MSDETKSVRFAKGGDSREEKTPVECLIEEFANSDSVCDLDVWAKVKKDILSGVVKLLESGETEVRETGDLIIYFDEVVIEIDICKALDRGLDFCTDGTYSQGVEEVTTILNKFKSYVNKIENALNELEKNKENMPSI